MCNVYYNDNKSQIMKNSKLIIMANSVIKWFTIDKVLPTILVPFLIFLATLHLSLTVIVFCILPILIGHIYLIFKISSSSSKFLYFWSIISLFYIFICFEFLIVPFHVISPFENILFYALFVNVLIFSYKIRKSSHLFIRKPHKISDKSFKDTGFCPVCRFEVPETGTQSHHNFWIDCCINSLNHENYIVLLSLLFGWLIYTIYLILTTVCLSHLKHNLFLVPYDCPDVYSNWRFAVCFMTAVYCTEIAILLFCNLLLKCTMKIIKKHKH